jgi:mRNA interferase MazF
LKEISYKNLEQGDIIYIDLNPTLGHEQRGRRPCIVLTKKTPFLGYMIGVAPITSKAKVFPLHVPLPVGLKVQGKILLDHHRMVDIESRGFSYVGKVPDNILKECLAKVRVLYTQ